ncbi:caspase-3-like [Ornithodoros turicata]|uniref:caspase-3-like n=1 Tax=Ornithodoros turicata TaxID=34597 RepID=UPI0031395E9C
MDPEHRKKLQDKNVIDALLQHINFDKLAQPLIEKKVFTAAMIDDIWQSEELADRNLKLLLKLPKRGPSAFTKFVEALRDTSQLEAENVLTGRTSEVRNNGRPIIGNAANDHASNGNLNGHSKVYEQSKHEIQVKLATEWKIGDYIYQMRRSPRGKCVIINNYDFRDLLELREGSQLDVQRLDRLFKALGFEVIVRQDKTKTEIVELLKTLSDERHQKDADCFVLILMSHGDQDIFYDVEKEEIEINSLIGMFNNINCPTLCGKPKLFFIQACRGDQHDAGIPVLDTTDAGQFPAASPRNSKPDKHVPAWTDIYVAYSTTPGYVSNKNPVTGSWFMHALFTVFASMACNTHLESMMKEVTARLHSRASHDGAKQSPEIRQYGWTKKLYFNPGLRA